MKFELTEEQAQDLINWEKQHYIECGLSAWGKYFDKAMAVAKFLRVQQEQDSYFEKLANSFTYSVAWCDTAGAYVGVCNQYPSLYYSALNITDAIDGVVKHTKHMLKENPSMEKHRIK